MTTPRPASSADPTPATQGLAAAAESHWTALKDDWWKRIVAPLRPTQGVADAIGELVAGRTGITLLMGVTPELAALDLDTVAIDRSPTMIANVWPGNAARRKVVRANWLRMPIGDGKLGAAIGDGSLNTLTFPDQYRVVFAELARALSDEGRVVLRLFEQPRASDSLESLREVAACGKVGVFAAFRWRFAMAVAAHDGGENVAAQRILQQFDRLFPDREALGRRCGWSAEEIAMVEIHRRSSEHYSFPTGDAFCSVASEAFAQVRRVPTDGYELSERCPLYVIDR